MLVNVTQTCYNLYKGDSMAKTAYVNVRVEEDDKIMAEQILNDLGINTSTAIDMFLKQIILKDGLPFDVRLPRIDFEKYQVELASELKLKDEKPYPKWLCRIASLYARGYIDHDVAIYAGKKASNLG